MPGRVYYSNGSGLRGVPCPSQPASITKINTVCMIFYNGIELGTSSGASLIIALSGTTMWDISTASDRRTILKSCTTGRYSGLANEGHGKTQAFSIGSYIPTIMLLILEVQLLPYVLD